MHAYALYMRFAPPKSKNLKFKNWLWFWMRIEDDTDCPENVKSKHALSD